MKGDEEMDKETFKNYLIDLICEIQEDFKETYKNDDNDALSIYVDKSGYINVFSLDKDGNHIIQISLTKEE